MKNEPITQAQLEVQDALTDLILGNHSIEDILKSVSRVCRMGETLHTKMRDFGRAGDYANYANTIEKLFDE
jgi:hypothetical protein